MSESRATGHLDATDGRDAKAANLALRLADLAMAAGVGVIAICGLLAGQPWRRRRAPAVPPRLMVIDSWHSLGRLVARQAEGMITHRDLDGYFDHVWNVNPLVGADAGDALAIGVGPPTITPLNRAHTRIEGRIGRYESLARLPYLNFALAQVQVVLMLDRIIRHEDVAIIRGDPYYHGLLAHLLGGLNGRPVELRIVANHDLAYETIGALAYPRLLRWRAVERRVAHYTLSRADSVVIGSADNREFALRNGARPERIAYIGNWSMINPIHRSEPSERPAPDEDFGFGDRPIVVCVTRLERVKHPEDLVVCIAAARRGDPRVAAVIVGDGSMRGELEALCEKLGVAEDIAFAGERDQSWISRMLAHSAVIVAPLAGLALVEAALSATVIVAYDVEWHAELIRSGREGILVAHRDADAMGAALRELVADPEQAARLGRAARDRALELMRPARILAHERAHYDEVLRLAGTSTSRNARASR